MASLRDFMEQVVPWPEPTGPGYINLHYTSPKGPGFRGRPFKDVKEFLGYVQYAVSKPEYYKDIYFCLSRQSEVGAPTAQGKLTALRNAENATHLKAIWLDVDVKKGGYETTEEALDALTVFTDAAKLPPPSALVFSGSGGFHVYWISDRALTQTEWRPYAAGLKRAAIEHGLKCDASITADAARVLRVPGTLNYKTGPNRVSLAHLGPAYDFAVDCIALEQVSSGAPSAASSFFPTTPDWIAQGPAQAFKDEGIDPHTDKLSDGINDHQEAALNPDAIITGCAHYQEAAKTQGANHAEPLWNLTLLGTTWFEDGREWAHQLSKGHPNYVKEETEAKYDRKVEAREAGTGWPSCQVFEAAGAACQACPLRGTIKSPLNLGRRERAKPEGGTGVVGPGDAGNGLGDLPVGYQIDPKTGWICQVVTSVEGKGENAVETRELFPLFMCKLRNFNLQRGTRKILFETSLDMDTWGPVSLYETDLATELTLVKALRAYGVKPYPNNQKRLVQFMTSFSAKLDAAKKRINTVPFGWLRKEKGGHEPIGFAYGGKVVMNDGTEQIAGFSDQQVEASYNPKGDESLWWELHKIVTDQKHPPIEVPVAMSFGAPLMFATNIYNGVFCIHSPGSGGHKSTSIDLGAAVWGSPVLTKERPISSRKGILRTMGHVKNLPVYMDEVSEDEHMDEIRTVVNYLSEGADGTKLHADRTMFDKESWQTLVMVGSNRSLCENILRHVPSTDAKLQRVFEYEAPIMEDTMDPNHVARLTKALDYNYGNVGLLYSGMLGRDPEGISKFVQAVHTKFNQEVDHVSVERFRSAMAAATFAGAALANDLGCSFNLPEMWEFLKQQYFAQRQMIKSAQTVGGTADNTVTTFTQFIKAHAQNILVIEHMPIKRPGPPVIAYLSGPCRDRPNAIHMRFSQSERVIEVSRKKFEAWLTLNKNSSAVVEGLKKHYGAKMVDRVDMAAGSGCHGGRETILSIPVPEGSPFEGVLFTNAPLHRDPVVTGLNGANGHANGHAKDGMAVPDAPEQMELPLPSLALPMPQ